MGDFRQETNTGTSAVNLAKVSPEALLDELRKRGAFSDLGGASGALYDHLERTGSLDGDTKLTSYLTFRMRREVAVIESLGGANSAGVTYWASRIAALDESTADGSPVPQEGGAMEPASLAGG